MKVRLDKVLVERGMAETRSQAENFIRLEKVLVNGIAAKKPGFFVSDNDKIELMLEDKYVSRAGLKLASVAKIFKLNFKGKVVLDVGSSTGGFTDFSLQNGAIKVVAVDVGTNQLHPKLRLDNRVELYEKTDIRDFQTDQNIDIALIDVSFISLKEILPSVARFCGQSSIIVAMLKPQFETKTDTIKGVVKNNSARRKIIKDFEEWCKLNKFFIQQKRDSDVKGKKGNHERFYILKV